MRNPVAKHSRRFNKASLQRDRKKDAKRGYQKHRPPSSPGHGPDNRRDINAGE